MEIFLLEVWRMGSTGRLPSGIARCLTACTSSSVQVAKWFAMCPTLQNATRHVILRERRNRVQMFGLVIGAPLGSNPRNRILPSSEMICESVAELEERLQTCRGGFTKGSLATDTQIGVLTHDLTNQMWHDVVCQADACPWLSYDTVDQASDMMHRFRMRGGGWDKALFKPSGFYRTLAVIHWTDSYFRQPVCNVGLVPHPCRSTCPGGRRNNAACASKGCSLLSQY